MLIERYEKEHFPIDAPDPVEAIKFRMEQLGMKQKDLDKIIGGKNRVSEILNRKRKLTLEMIRNIHASLDIPLESLIQAYWQKRYSAMRSYNNNFLIRTIGPGQNCWW